MKDLKTKVIEKLKNVLDDKEFYYERIDALSNLLSNIHNMQNPHLENMNNPALIFEKFGNIMSAHARVQGMVAENQCRLSRNESLAFTDDAFETQAIKIDQASLFLLNLSSSF